MKRIALVIAAPAALAAILLWNEKRKRLRASDRPCVDALLALRGSGRDLWADEHADEYVRRLRAGWE